jgi:hypothetical protein
VGHTIPVETEPGRPKALPLPDASTKQLRHAVAVVPPEHCCSYGCPDVSVAQGTEAAVGELEYRECDGLAGENSNARPVASPIWVSI